jgi:polysaccharide export outer membrane protein
MGSLWNTMVTCVRAMALVPALSLGFLQPASAQPPQASTLATSPADYEYKLGSGDALRVIVYGEETISGQFTVAGNGILSFPLIGDVPASGKTVAQVRDAIVAGLRDGYIKEPNVSVEVTTYRPYFILGEVARPGQYPYSDRITVINAIATAGGFTYRANQRYVFVKSAGGETEHKEPLNDKLSVAPGDTIRVAERYF